MKVIISYYFGKNKIVTTYVMSGLRAEHSEKTIIFKLFRLSLLFPKLIKQDFCLDLKYNVLKYVDRVGKCVMQEIYTFPCSYCFF